MKVFALICAAAIAISTEMIEAASVPVACDALVCSTKAKLDLPKGDVAVYTPPACDPATEKAYLKQIDIVGGAGDLYTFVTKSDGTALTDTCVNSVAGINLKAGDTTPLTCGSGLDTAVTVEVTCARTDDNGCGPTSNTVTFACAAKAEDPPAAADVAVACTDLVCTKADIKIPNGQKAVYTPPACDPTSQKAYLKQIAVTGKTGDKLTFVTKSGTTALTDTCVDSTAGETIAGGTAEAPLTCGSGLDTVVTVEVSCARDDKADCAPTANTVTFACAAKAAETPAPSTGSMLTKANAIVGVISGMVGAIVYFNRG